MIQLSIPCLAACLITVGAAAPAEPVRAAQVTGLRAFHRAGQTFLTWRDPQDSFGDRPATWRELQDCLGGTDARPEVRYRIYRHTRPIDAGGVAAGGAAGGRRLRVRLPRPAALLRGVDRPAALAPADVLQLVGSS